MFVVAKGFSFVVKSSCPSVHNFIPFSIKASGLSKKLSINSNMRMNNFVSLISQQDAAEIDKILMGPLGFSVDQLMELAGLSVATAIGEVYKPSTHSRVLVICGSGNNGGDGLVAARHLYHFGYKPCICYPVQTLKPLYAGLTTQLESLSIPFLSSENLHEDISNEFDIILDAIFGFSFHGAPRQPFKELLERLVSWKKIKGKPVVVSIDIPSGWHVEDGDINGMGFMPDMLVSLTAPKLCSEKFSGLHHFLGGRFVPPDIFEKFNLQLPAYPGTSMCVRIAKSTSADLSSLRVDYISPLFLEEHAEVDPIDQFANWFNDAVNTGLKDPNAMSLSTVGKDGKPSSRMVLLKAFDRDGFVWCSNYGSRKGCELSVNPYASLLFYWSGFNRQVRVEGCVQLVTLAESESYFHNRPRDSQIAAIVSKQSSAVSGRNILDVQFKEMTDKLSKRELIPKPENWGGYRLKPDNFEFWQGQQSRMHDRLCYSLEMVGGKESWRIQRLAP